MWQTEAWSPPAVGDPRNNGGRGGVPKNDYGNYELWDGDARLLPRGAEWLRNMPRVAKVAGQLGVDFAPAVVGFSHGSGRAVPDTDGIIVAAADAPLLREAYQGWAEEQVRKDHLKRERRRIGRWASLVTKVLTRARLEAEYGK